MSQKLIWNFEFSLANESLAAIEETVKEKNKWETRFFWSDNECILLQAIDECLYDLSHYQYKQKTDCYYLIPNTSYNIKQRRDRLLYKPLLEQSPLAIAFAKKIDLELVDDYPKKYPKEVLLNILSQAQTMANRITVSKQAYVYKLPTKPSIKLELARLEVHNQIYFSVCVEGRSRQLVEKMSKLMVGKKQSSQYISFLKEIVES